MLEILAAGISTFDRAKRCRGSEQYLDPVILNDPPEHPCIGRADRFSLKQHGRTAGNQRRIGDVGMANDPADVGCGPIDLARLRVIDVRHAPVQCHRMSTIVTDDALWLAGGSRGVKDIEWIGRLDRDRGYSGRKS